MEFDKKEIDISNMKDIIGIDKLPLSNTYVSIEIKNIPTAYINAFRRVSIDELKNYALQVPSDTNWDLSTDNYMLIQFVSQRISLIPIKYMHNIDYESIKFDLTMHNLTVKPMFVYTKHLKLISGKLSEPIFNPTFKICVLQPGKQINISNIFIGTGYGKNNASFQKVRCGTYYHKDIEQYTQKEINDPSNTISDHSGYKISSLIADPRHHVYSCIVPATTSNTNDIKQIFIDVCFTIVSRLKHIIYFIEATVDNENINQNIEYNVIQLNNGIYEGILQLDETYTIAEILKKTIFDIYPDVINIKYNIVDKLKFIIQYKEHVTPVLTTAIKKSITSFELLQDQISKYKIK